MKNQASKRIIGMDLHPDVFTVAAFEGSDPVNAKKLWVKDRVPVSKIEQWAKKTLTACDIVLMEASGNSFAIASKLHKLGFKAVVLDANTVGRTSKALCSDDKESAVRIARVYMTGLCNEVWTPDSESQTMREIFFGYRNAAKERTRFTNRIKCFLNGIGIRLRKGMRLTKSDAYEKTLTQGDFTEERKMLLKNYFLQLWAAEGIRKQYDNIMLTKVTGDKVLREMLKIYGVSYKIIYAFKAMIGDVGRFPNAKKLVSYVGLSPRKVQSGNDAKGNERGVGRRCRNDLRTLFAESAQVIMRNRNNPWHKWAWQIMARRGHKHIAIIAVARKIAIQVWYGLTGKSHYVVKDKGFIQRKMKDIANGIEVEKVIERGFGTRTEYALFLENLLLVQHT